MLPILKTALGKNFSLAVQWVNKCSAPMKTFAEAYPQLAELSVDVIIHEKLIGGNTETARYDLTSSLEARIACPNPNCEGGGFSVNAFLGGVLSGKPSPYEAPQGCRGVERMSRNNTRRCMAHCAATVAYSLKQP